ncbi:uncharacterized protein LOC134824113 [Bolinopsis microptera]|uniref:uncharacterized protein LOC134824113 n=1 Tax=Bolinopsis microptera TaxID=2820187 RepID=UPI00307936F0
MFSFGGDTRTCTDRNPRKKEQRSKSNKDSIKIKGLLSAVSASEPPVRIPTTTVTAPPEPDLSRIHSGLMTQIRVANGSAVRSPLLHKRYKNFDGISGKDDSRIKDVDSMEQFKRAVLSAHDSLVCVTFSAKWCGPWRMIKPDVHRLSHIHGDVIFYEVDVDDNEEIAAARRVVCMPTFQFFKCGYMLDKFAEPNRIKLDETIRKLRRLEVKEDEYRFERFPPVISSRG